MAHGNKGKTAWNKGLTKKTDKRVKQYSNSLKNSSKHWSRSDNADKIKKEISKRMKGKKLSEIRKKEISEASSGENNGMYGKQHSQESIEKMKITCKKRWQDKKYREKFKESHWANNDDAQKIGNKISETRAKLISEGKIIFPPNHGYKSGYYFSEKSNDKMFYRSSYELIRLNQLENDELVKTFTINHGIKLKYEHNGKMRHYIPDILVEYFDGKIELEEIKGWIRDKEVFDKKCTAAKKYCKINNIKYKVLFKGDINGN